jgi:hypothetical protein
MWVKIPIELHCWWWRNDALTIIIQLDDLWTRIDRAWMILGHWKDHNRIMPTESHEDFSLVIN